MATQDMGRRNSQTCKRLIIEVTLTNMPCGRPLQLPPHQKASHSQTRGQATCRKHVKTFICQLPSRLLGHGQTDKARLWKILPMLATDKASLLPMAQIALSGANIGRILHKRLTSGRRRLSGSHNSAPARCQTL